MLEEHLGDDDEIVRDLSVFEVVETIGEPERQVREVSGPDNYALSPAGPSAGDRRWLAVALLVIAFGGSVALGAVAPSADQELWARYQALLTPWQTLLALAIGYFFAVHHKP